MTRNWAPRFISHLMRKYLESVINWTTRELDPNASCCCWPMQNFPFLKIFFSYYSYSFTYHTYTRSKNWSHILFSIGLASFFAPCLKYKIPTTKQKKNTAYVPVYIWMYLLDFNVISFERFQEISCYEMGGIILQV